MSDQETVANMERVERYHSVGLDVHRAGWKTPTDCPAGRCRIRWRICWVANRACSAPRTRPHAAGYGPRQERVWPA
jgi:hypothetical protein